VAAESFLAKVTQLRRDTRWRVAGYVGYLLKGPVLGVLHYLEDAQQLTGEAHVVDLGVVVGTVESRRLGVNVKAVTSKGVTATRALSGVLEKRNIISALALQAWRTGRHL
jgi:hypothetical protein